MALDPSDDRAQRDQAVQMDETTLTAGRAQPRLEPEDRMRCVVSLGDDQGIEQAPHDVAPAVDGHGREVAVDVELGRRAVHGRDLGEGLGVPCIEGGDHALAAADRLGL